MGKTNGIDKGDSISLKPISKQVITSEYVLQSAINNSDSAKLAVGLSTNEILLFDLASTAKLLTLKGHKQSVTGIKFSEENPSMVFTSSLDGNIYAWDIREGLQPVQSYFDDTDGPLKSLLCFDLNRNERYICAGTELIREDAFLIFWDLRTSQNLGGYWHSHTEEITHLQFHLESNSSLASASVDGLINIFDLTEGTEDDALINTINIDTSVNRFSWNSKDLISCITGTEEYQFWYTDEPSPCLTLNREDLSKLSQCQVDYLIDTFIVDNSFYLATGSNDGSVQLYHQDGEKLKPASVLENGHSDVVRTVSLSQDNCLVTGGEDGQLCLWKVSL